MRRQLPTLIDADFIRRGDNLLCFDYREARDIIHTLLISMFIEGQVHSPVALVTEGFARPDSCHCRFDLVGF